ncbi:MAG: DUF4365 domain-containing protein [Planctomycetota bacterium]
MKQTPLSKSDYLTGARSTGARPNADIGDHGELWFAAELPIGWVWQPPRRDLGKDGLIVVRDNSDIHNLEFAVQIKSSIQPLVRDGHIVKSGVSRSAVQYWFASPLPTLVVAVDTTKRCGWFAWHLDLFDSPAEVFGGDAETLTIRIPERNRLNQDGWGTVRRQLKQHFGSLQNALGDAQLASKLLPAVNLIATAVGNLVKLASSPPPQGPPTGDEGMTILLEQLQHRDLLHAARSILRRIDPGSDAHKQIEFCIEAYEATVLSAHPRLNQLPTDNNIPADLEMAYAPKLMVQTRQSLIEAGIDMIRLLTRSQHKQ